MISEVPTGFEAAAIGMELAATAEVAVTPQRM
jgi:hypothetical protein